MRRVDNKNEHFRYFEGTGEFLAKAEEVLRGADADSTYNGLKCASISGDKAFTGTDSLGESVKLARYGWPEGVDKMRDKAAQIDALAPQGFRVEFHNDIDGDEADIDAYLQGIPENMQTLVSTLDSAPGKVIRICVNRAANCGISADRIIRYGTALLIVVETAASLGYSVELSIAQAVTQGGYERYEAHVPILQAGEPINLDTLAFWLVHPSVLRRLVFAVEETESADLRRTMGFYSSRGYGQSATLKTTPDDSTDLMLSNKDGQLHSDADILPTAKGWLKQVGIDLNAD